MRLRVVEGGLGSLPSGGSEPGPSRLPHDRQDVVPGVMPGVMDVRREAERRLRTAGYEALRNREIATGIPMSRDMSHLCMQIRYVAEALGKLTSIPQDFRSDIYWPTPSRGAV
jgi:hypothetical protein